MSRNLLKLILKYNDITIISGLLTQNGVEWYEGAKSEMLTTNYELALLSL